MKLIFSILFVLVSFYVKAQDNKEFEGIIKYNHSFDFDEQSPYDTVGVKNALGTSSIFYYKNGSYKWVLATKPAVTEYFDGRTQTTYYEFDHTDTLFKSVVKRQNSLLGFEKLDKQKTVCGKLCKAVEVITATRGKEKDWMKRVLYYSDSIYIGDNVFSGYQLYASSEVFKRIKCWPIKIEMEGPAFPKTTMEAVQISRQPISDSLLYIPENRVIKNY
jgi:hypothetical protein